MFSTGCQYQDNHRWCPYWKSKGYCSHATHSAYMRRACQKSCKCLASKLKTKQTVEHIYSLINRRRWYFLAKSHSSDIFSAVLIFYPARSSSWRDSLVCQKLCWVIIFSIHFPSRFFPFPDQLYSTLFTHTTVLTAHHPIYTPYADHSTKTYSCLPCSPWFCISWHHLIYTRN